MKTFVRFPPNAVVEETKVTHPPLFFWRFEMLESEIKADFKQCIKDNIFYGDMVHLVEPKTYQRSEPDLYILGHGRKWAAIEFKTAVDADRQPQQDRRMAILNHMSFARFVYPDNAVEVLDELEKLFTS